MAQIDTVNLSDIGKSLCAIESEILANKLCIEQLQKQIVRYQIKNIELSRMAKSLMAIQLPSLTEQVSREF